MLIYVITHKKFSQKCKKNGYIPLLVGAENNFGEDFYLNDDTGDNISKKNKSFCELTGVYWVWKHSTEDIVGICHYRRYFTLFRNFLPKQFCLSSRYIYKLLEKYDAILPVATESSYNGYTAKEFFCLKHDKFVWDKCGVILQAKYPDYYSDFLWFEQEKKGYCYNMIICRKDYFDRYCAWLFDILFELEKQVDVSQYSDYNARMFGFVSERLINIWLHHNKLLVKEMPIYFTDRPPLFRRIGKKLKKVFNI